jgi:hypothetical protein
MTRYGPGIYISYSKALNTFVYAYTTHCGLRNEKNNTQRRVKVNMNKVREREEKQIERNTQKGKGKEKLTKEINRHG